MFERFSDAARLVVVHAQEEARLLQHNYIGTEHLLLALLEGDADGIGAQALLEAGVTLEGARAEVLDIIGRGESMPSVHIPFTPRAKKVLELALRECLQLGGDEIGSEHILLGLIREGSGVGARVVEKLGGDLAQLRQRVITLIGMGEADPERATAELRSAVVPPPRPVLRCSFCGRSEDKITHLLVAGGMLLCDQCARDAVVQLDLLPEDAPKRVRFRRREVGLSDKDAAMRAIERAFEAVIGPSRVPPADALWAVEGGAETEVTLRELDEDSQHVPMAVNDVTVERVRFLDQFEAEVTLGIWMAGNAQPMLQPAHAVVVDGTWKVSRASVEFFAAQASQFRRR